MMTRRIMLIMNSSLLLIPMPLLQHSGTGKRTRRLPGGSPDKRDSVGIGEDGFNLFEGPSRGLGEHEEHVDEHCGAEDAK